MSFSNLLIATDQIPSASELEFTPMAGNYRKEVLTQQLIIWGIFLLLSVVPWIAVSKPESLKAWLALLPLGPLLLGTMATAFSYRAAQVRGFLLREHDIAYRTGLIFRKVIFLAFNRIQHIEISQGPLQRKFGLASLKCFTAGGISVDMKIDGLSKNDAQSLRQLILAKIGGALGPGNLTHSQIDAYSDRPIRSDSQSA